MSNLNTFLFSLFLISTLTAIGQPNWRVVVTPVFATLTQEANDSIAAEQEFSEKIRLEMNKIIDLKGFDRALIVGKDEEYIKEGMYKHFTRAPTSMQLNIERDKDVVRLEQLHAQLYESDKALFHWRNIQAKLKNHPDKTNYTRWTNEYNNLPTAQRPDPQSTSQWQEWVTNQLVCELANQMQVSNPEYSKENVRSFEPKFIELKEKKSETPSAKKQLPILADDLLCSFPMNGQFAFHLSETTAKVGYINLPSNSMQAVYDLRYKDYKFKARWTSSNHDVNYTKAELKQFGNTIFFNLPEMLEEGLVYRLEIVAIPPDYKMPDLSKNTCWAIYRNKSEPTKSPTYEHISDEAIITAIYFRAGKYDVRQKLQTMKGTVDWQLGAIIYETDEPLDPLELYGSGLVPTPVTFDLQTSPYYKIYDALNSNQVFYYLTVPTVEPIENRSPSDLLIAELDNSYNAPFVRKTSLGNPKVYPGLPEPRTHDIKLAGNYIAPAFQRHGLADSLVTSKPVPYITREYFNNNTLQKFAVVQCTLYIGELKQLISSALLEQSQLRKRVDERVDFFYQLEERHAIREGKTLSVTKEQLQKQEMENLPAEVKLLLDAKIPECFAKNFTLIYGRRFPATERWATEFELKLDSKQ